MLKLRAFTLIELLISIAIISIIATVAIPSYVTKIREAKTSEAIEALQFVMQAQERYYGDSSTYSIDLKELGYTDETTTSTGGLYEITASLCAAAVPATQCIQLVAEPVRDSGQEESGDFGLNSRGEKWRDLPPEGDGTEKVRIDSW